MKSVLHVSPAGFGATGVVGGAERYALELARHMAERVPTRLLCFGAKRSRERVGKLVIDHVPTQWSVHGEAQNPFSLKLFGESFSPAIVHCHQKHVLATSLTALWRRLLRRKVFVTDLGGGGWDVSAYVSTQKWFDGELHISEYSRSLAKPPHPNSTVIWGGVDSSRFTPGSGERDGSVLFVGRILPHKGIDYLIEELPDGMRLDVIGQPYDRTYLGDLKSLAEGKQVRFFHGLTDDELIGAYRRAVAVVLPSLYRDRYGHESRVPELLGQTLLEAMACGTPAIGTRVASLPEVIDHEKTGFLVDSARPGDLKTRLRWLANHPDEVRRLGEQARRHAVDVFSWDAVVDRCFAAYGF